MKKRTKNKIKKIFKNYLIYLILLIIAILVILFKSQILAFLGTFNISQSIINNDNSGGSTPGVIDALSCSDSDGGKNIYTAGYAKDQDGIRYYDQCFSQPTIQEYYCDGNEVKQWITVCPPGSICTSTRSGGYCYTPDWQDGDTIGSGSDSGSLIPGVDGDSWEIDLSDNFVSGAGTCGLMALIETSWNYGNEYCQGIQGGVAVQWGLSDSDSVEYTRIDNVPVAMGVPTACTLDWDGVTPFEFWMDADKALFPNCEIDYNWEVTLVACNC